MSERAMGNSRTTVLFTNWGPHVWHDGQLLHVEDINPPLETKWRLTRGEMLRMAWRLVVAAVRARVPPNDLPPLRRPKAKVTFG